MQKNTVEIHIIVDKDGVNSIQIVGPTETHPNGHDLYLHIRDLVQDFDRAIQQRIKEGKELNA